MPVTLVSIDGEQDALGFFKGQVWLTLTASDTGTGVLKSEYSLDGGNTWQVYQTPVLFDSAQVPVLFARSVDEAGNQEYPFAERRLQPFQVNLPAIIK